MFLLVARATTSRDANYGLNLAELEHEWKICNSEPATVEISR